MMALSIGFKFWWVSIIAILIGKSISISSSEQENIVKNLNLPTSFKIYPTLRRSGMEMIPNGNFVSKNGEFPLRNEPNCEELRAMWRYYRRQVRNAELTNEIPKFQLKDAFMGVEAKTRAFGNIGSFGIRKGGFRSRFRPKSLNKSSLYGRVLFTEKSKDTSNRRGPMDEIISIFGLPSSISKSESSIGDSNLEKSDEPKIIFSPPIKPTPKSGIDKIKEIFRNEGIKENNPSSSRNNEEYGTVILSPPRGQDGRVANKPKELMTPFERIRFGHVDDLFNGKDEIPSHLIQTKRANGFIPLPIFNSYTINPFLIRNEQQLNPIGSSSLKDEINEKLMENSISSSIENDFIKENKVSEQGNILRTSFLSDFEDKNKSVKKNNEIKTDDGTSFHGIIQLDHPSVDQIFKETNQPILIMESDMGSKPLCHHIQNIQCSVNSDCSCVGNGLYRCKEGTCEILSLSFHGNEFGIWHSEPLETEHLGIWEEAIPNKNKDKTVSTINNS